MGNRPEFSRGNLTLTRGVEVTDNLQIGFWFNIGDSDLNNRLIQYYREQQANQNWKNQPGISLEVKIGDNYHPVSSGALYFNDGSKQQQPAVAPPPPPNAPPPPPPPHTSVPDAPPPPMEYSEAKDG